MVTSQITFLKKKTKKRWQCSTLHDQSRIRLHCLPKYNSQFCFDLMFLFQSFILFIVASWGLSSFLLFVKFSIYSCLKSLCISMAFWPNNTFVSNNLLPHMTIRSYANLILTTIFWMNVSRYQMNFQLHFNPSLMFLIVQRL